MILALITGLVIGFLMCIPIGPINVWVINTQLRKGAKSALAIAGGGSLMDFIYFYIILSGLSFFSFSESIINFFKVIGILVIFGMGVKELLFSSQSFNEEFVDQARTKTIVTSFLVGIILYTSNPGLIVTMTALGAFLKSLDLFEFNLLNILIVSLGLAMGSFLWFVCLSHFVKRYQEAIRTKYMAKVSKLSGLLMLLLGIFMSIKILF
ncbi:LysE family translocator [Bacteriovorax sp. Seq25_V]|uniref:LysE family translocator n=1 Tax=Bacteriovorax sp. Seq25_V TaxID=1201288 RepID=UPI00038A25A4|nr:LysE family transporter [Bacteriovorax sp. Seq25_V]EQC44055.1 translocator protein, LysE family [Bacteriovorax sp. Seq25_V]